MMQEKRARRRERKEEVGVRRGNLAEVAGQNSTLPPRGSFMGVPKPPSLESNPEGRSCLLGQAVGLQ